MKMEEYKRHGRFPQQPQQLLKYKIKTRYPFFSFHLDIQHITLLK